MRGQQSIKLKSKMSLPSSVENYDEKIKSYTECPQREVKELHKETWYTERHGTTENRCNITSRDGTTLLRHK